MEPEQVKLKINICDVEDYEAVADFFALETYLWKYSNFPERKKDCQLECNQI